ncbi:hypothetical protein [Nocardioides sp. SYSU D00065]|uniref:hypothetical protein n=1 Tax=Nocardioides sp. SYSU D00065 TaxID=2817378 RepID=UPI001B339AD2|nr:hypothetical protein [Nocardioides sp. SYSU D00065]
MAVASTAPAFAASPCNCPEFFVPAFPASGTAGNGWSFTASGGTSGGGNDGFSNGSFVTVADPAGGGVLSSAPTRRAVASRTICVTQGRTYRFSYSWTAYLVNPRPMTSVLTVAGAAVAGSLIDTDAHPGSGTRSVTWTATTTGNVEMAFVHTTVAQSTLLGWTTTADDITISNLTGTCA